MVAANPGTGFAALGCEQLGCEHDFLVLLPPHPEGPKLINDEVGGRTEQDTNQVGPIEAVA